DGGVAELRPVRAAHGSCHPGRRVGAGGSMTAATLDPARLRELFDLRSSVYATRGGAFEDDPNPGWHELRATGPVHEGIPGPLVGFHGEAVFQGLPYPDRP